MSDKSINIADFSYELPDERIARYPLAERESAKLLHYQNGAIADYHFTDLPDLLPPGVLLIGNATKVIHARLHLLTPSGKAIEVFCLDPLEPADYQQSFSSTKQVVWKCLVGGNRKWKEGLATLDVPLGEQEIQLQLQRLEAIDNAYAVQFSWTEERFSFGELLDAAGQIPLPPYLGRAAEASDHERYQTVFAQTAGSVAAPTAALHLSKKLLERLKQQNMNWAEVILHVGAGTFKPVTTEALGGHDMHAEYFEVGRLFLQRLMAQLQSGNPIITVGTTSTRCVESLYYLGSMLLRKEMSLAEMPVPIPQWIAQEQNHSATPLQAIEAVLEALQKSGYRMLKGHTQLILTPSTRLQIADGLITNFHQPNSTLLLIVAAVTGSDWQRIYQHALDNNYRFLSYGDGSLLMKR